jgi:hypothetical protein
VSAPEARRGRIQLTILPEADARPEAAPLYIDTTQGSWLHQVIGRSGLSAFRLYVYAALLTYLPLLFSVLISRADPLHPSLSIKLPFLHDGNIAFMLLVSFPTLFVFAIRDQPVLAAALRRIQKDGVLTLSQSTATNLEFLWRKKFIGINRAAYITGVVSGVVITYVNYHDYTPKSVGFWIAIDGRLQICGYVFLACVFALFALIPIYVIRTFAISLFLRRLVGHADELHMLPFHPDKCGGLRPVGRLGLRNQYLLTVFGLNLGTLVADSEVLKMPYQLYPLLIAAAIGYIVLGPLIFMSPLLSFRSGMLRTKMELMSEVAQRLRVELRKLRAHLPSGDITKADEELIDRLRKVGAVIDELPVWPFDASTLRRFLTAYLVPLLGALAGGILKTMLDTRLLHK